jgi:tetratricopeptide (TPR) repeat protein
MDPRETFNAKLQDFRKRARSAAAEVERLRMNRWSALPSGLLAQLLQSRNAAERCVEHADADVRGVAIEVLSRFWGAAAEEAFRSELEKIAFTDPDFAVRSAAIRELAEAYLGSDNVRIGTMLARAVHDGTLPHEFRWAAYCGLHRLRRMRAPLWPGFFARPQSMPRIQEDVEWAFVSSFLIPGRTASPVDVFCLLPETVRNRYRSAQLGISAYERLDFTAAISHFTAALAENPNAAGLLYMRGHSYLEIGDVDAAVADLSRAIELAPTPASLYRRGDAYKTKGLLEIAEQDYRRAARLDRKGGQSGMELPKS